MKAKRILSILLALMMALSMISGISVAANATSTVAALPDGTVFVDLSWTETTTPASIDVNGKTFILTWGTNAYADLQTALDAAPANGTVYMCAGTYSGEYVVKKNLTILGTKYGIDPNVKGADELAAWTRNTARGTDETVLTGKLNLGVATKTVYADATDMTVDGLHITGNGHIRSNAGTAGKAKMTLKNLYITASTQIPLYLQPYWYDQTASTNPNLYQRDVVIANVRIEGLTSKDAMVLTAEKADISGVYMHSDCTKTFMTSISASGASTDAVEWTIRDSMFCATVNRVIYLDCANNSASVKYNSSSTATKVNKDIANRTKVTTNVKDCVFLNSHTDTDIYTLSLRTNTANTYFNFTNNTFYTTGTVASNYAPLAGYSDNTSIKYGSRITVDKNKFIGVQPICWNFGAAGEAVDVSGNYYEDAEGNVDFITTYGPTTQEWWYMDRAMTKKSDSIDIPTDRLVDIEKDVKWLGRTYVEDNRHYFNWSNAGFEFNIHGTGATAFLSTSNPGGTNTAFLKVYVDGVFTKEIKMNWPNKVVTLAENLSDGHHTIKVVKRSNGRSSTAALRALWVDEGTKVCVPNAVAGRKMQFVGDSITVGYGSMATSGDWTTETEDGTITYTALTAQYFGADNHTIAVSGRGIYKNYGNADPENRAPFMYEFTDWNNKEDWDHTKYTPDVIVVNYGTNDNSAGVTPEEFKPACKEFVQQVRSDNPNAIIIYAFGFMGTSFAPQIEEVVSELNAAGDKKIYYLALAACEGEEKGVSSHPTAAAHADRAQVLIAKVKELTGWDEHKTCDPKETVITAPTCGAAGEDKYVCSVCGATEIKEVAATGNHTPATEVTTVTAPTCVATGVGKKLCTVCGADAETGIVIPATGEHTAAEEVTVVTAATCGADGVGKKLCTVCGADAQTGIVIPATGNHTPATEVTVVTPATCGADGVGKKLCSVCGADAQTGIVIPATGKHAWDKGIVTKEPTSKDKGVKTFTCGTCGATKTETLDKTGVDVLTVFKDIKKKDWFVKNGAIDFVYNNGLFAGTTNTTFGPNENMTRGMFVTVLGRLHGVSSKGATTQFTDVKKKDYFSGYVAWAAKNGIVTGTSATTFAPNANVTREQICAMMVRYCDYAGIKLAKVNAAITFTDAKSISSYARKAVAACQQGGVVGGEKTDGGYRFRPQGNASRAEVATIMMNFSKNYIAK